MEDDELDSQQDELDELAQQSEDDDDGSQQLDDDELDPHFVLLETINAPSTTMAISMRHMKNMKEYIAP